MSRPAVEVADILRAQGSRFLDRYESSFDYQQLKAFRAIQKCRTAALGGHLDSCPQCGYQAISYNSCRNRHCPKCPTQARERWIAKREQELLSTSYFHVVLRSRVFPRSCASRHFRSRLATIHPELAGRC
jgi:Transposase zinc-binding domain